VALQQTYQSSKFVSLAVNTGEPSGIVSTYIKYYMPDLSVSVLVDPQGTVFSSFGGSGVPCKILINESGQIHWVGSGYSSPEKMQLLKQEIETLLGGTR
jgi:hypothetical protein